MTIIGGQAVAIVYFVHNIMTSFISDIKILNYFHHVDVTVTLYFSILFTYNDSPLWLNMSPTRIFCLSLNLSQFERDVEWDPRGHLDVI